MRRIFIFLLLFLAQTSARAALSSYVFSYGTGTYTAVTSASPGYSVLISPPWDEDLAYTPLPFNFVMDGVTFSAGTNLTVSANGWVELGGTSNYSAYPISWTPDPGTYTISALGGDLQSVTAANGPVAITQATYGTAPNRVFVIDYQKVRNYLGGAAQNFNFQIRLYESSNVIQVQYGSFAGNNGAANTKEVGIGTSSSFNSRTKASGTAWASTAASVNNYDAIAFTTTYPVVGATYTWTPPAVISISPTSMSFTAATSTNSTSQNVTLTGYGFTSGSITVTAPANFQVYDGTTWVSSMTITTSSALVGQYINTTVPVRFTAPATTGTSTGNLSFASTGATTRNVALTGNALLLCSGTPTPGTVSATATSGSCNAYSPTLSTTGTTSAFGITYQWQSSPDNVSYTNVSGATNATYIPSISSNIYYRSSIGCSASSLSATTPGVAFTYTSPPLPITGPTTVCTANAISLSSASSGGTWSSGASSIATVSSAGVVTGVAQGVANITYTAFGCPISAAITVVQAPTTPVVTNSVPAFCTGGSSTLSATATNSLTATSGTVSVTIPDASATGAFSALSVAGIPAGATITGVSVNFNISMTYDGDLSLNLTAPNGNTINLVNNVGGGGANFTNTTVSSSGSTGIGSGSAPFTGTYSAALATGAALGASGYAVNASAWSSLYSTPNGTWTFSGRDGAGGDIATITSWRITINFTMPSSSFIWSPTTNLYTNAGLTIPYTGTGVATVYAAPTATGTASVNTYSVVAGCSSAGTTTVTANPLPAAISGTPSVCQGLTTSLTNSTAGGTWQSSTSLVATIGSATGVANGIAQGTTTISYTLPTGCRSTTILTVNPLPSAIGGTKSVCVNATTSLTNTGGGTWSSSSLSTGTIGSTTGVLAGVSSGNLTVTYTLPTGCQTTTPATVNPLPATTLSATSATVCLGYGAAFTASAPLPTFSLLSENFNSGLPTGWSVTNGTGTPASYWQVVDAPSPGSGASGDGTKMLEADANSASVSGQILNTIVTSSSFSTAGYSAATLTFNQYLLSLTSDNVVAVEYSIDNGATWTSMLNEVGVGFTLPGGGTGMWDATSPEVSVALPSAAVNVSNLKLRWNYNSNGGAQWDIDNVKVTATQAPVSFTWAGPSGLACTSCASNTLTPTATGNNVYTVTSTTGAGCVIDQQVTVTVNPVPGTIDGTLSVCVNSTTTLSNTLGGGTWASPSANVSVAGTSGVVTGQAAGTATITYTTPAGCTTTTVVTVNSLPSATAGSQVVCEGSTTNLTNTTSGGTWSSENSSVASVNSSGVVTGGNTGNTNIYYTLTLTGCRVASVVTVNHTPVAIDGVLEVCEAATTALSDADGGGSWVSGSTAFATIDAASGVASGVLAGNSTITYTLGNGCRTTAVLTVNQLPEDIGGTPQVCLGLSTTLSNGTSGGTWLSSDVSIAPVDASGVVTGFAAGNAMVTYKMTGTGCAKYAAVTVNSLPAAINGTPEFCLGTSSTLSNTGGGTWSSGATGIATVDGGGVVTSVTDGTATITYTAPTTCIATMDVTVDPLPQNINGAAVACEGLTTTLTDLSADGTWSSSAFGIAVVDPTNGVVTGMAQGIATITYQLPTTCFITRNVTINSLPAAIDGNLQVCEGLTTTLSDISATGTWSIAGTAATISAGGVMTGVTGGTDVVTYTLPTGCLTTAIATVNQLPGAITGVKTVCEGALTTLATTSTDGTWSSSAIAIASIDQSGSVSGIGDGTATVTYQLPTTCITTAIVTVNPLPAAITGSGQVCVGSATGLSSTSVGGTWTSSDASIANIGSASGIVSGVATGNTLVTYTLPTGCNVAAVVTVDPLPAAITGSLEACLGVTAALLDADAGGTWSTDNPAVASVNANTGALTGAAAGNASVTYTLPTGCKTAATVTVNPLPAPIAGVAQACEGATATFTNGSPGGTWSSSTPPVAMINSSGVIAATASGTTLITYTLPTGCLRTRIFTVNAQPAANAGNANVCQSATTLLSNALNGGSWISGAPGIATVNASGLVAGNTTGIVPISYTMPTGCNAVSMVTVSALPAAISGATVVCEHSTVTLTDGTSGGSWVSGNTATASVDGATGIVTGVAAGSTIISYTMPSGCMAIKSFVVNAAPAAVTGGGPVCTGSNLALSNTATGGAWTSSNTAIATVGLFSGIVTGSNPGTVTVSYTFVNGCSATTAIVVNPTPAPITGPLAVCNGQTIGLASATTGGTWSSGNTAVATVGTSGSVTTVAPGNATITYGFGTGCMRLAQVTVNANPAAHTVTGGGSYCAGGVGVHIGLDGSNTGINYQLRAGTSPVGGLIPGTSGLIDFGSITLPDVYNVIAYNASSGCATTMASTVTVNVTPVVTPSVSLAASSPDTICQGTSTIFTATPVNGGVAPAFVWQVNGVPVTGATSSTYEYIPANTDVVTLAMSSNAACATPAPVMATRTMTVNPKMMPGTAVAVSPANQLCEGSTATFTATSGYGGTTPTFTWYKNAAVAGYGNTFSYVPASGDVVFVHLHSNYACRLADSVQSTSVIMHTVPVFIPTVSITADPSFDIDPNMNVTLTANVTGGGSLPTFQWYIGTIPVSGANTRTFSSTTFHDGDSVSCRVMGSGECGMPGFNSIVIRYDRTGITSVHGGSDIRLVPNPNKGEFTVKGTLSVKADREVAIEVTNMLGQVVYRGTVTARNGDIDQRVKLDNTLANGMYLLNLATENEKQMFHFIIEQ